MQDYKVSIRGNGGGKGAAILEEHNKPRLESRKHIGLHSRRVPARCGSSNQAVAGREERGVSRVGRRFRDPTILAESMGGPIWPTLSQVHPR